MMGLALVRVRRRVVRVSERRCMVAFVCWRWMAEL
jgi:hypothetical protein